MQQGLIIVVTLVLYLQIVVSMTHYVLAPRDAVHSMVRIQMQLEAQARELTEALVRVGFPIW